MADVISIESARFGATTTEWSHFDLVLGLGADLLPVVSNPNAVISPNSNMSSLGKTPSIYNQNRQVAGLPQWTQRQTTGANIEAWLREKDYGIALQTRTVRAIDVDISEPELAQRVRAFIADFLALQLPCRMRSNASKFLLAFELPGTPLPKRVMKVSMTSIIELLGTGRQFIAAGLHPSGVRYEWEGGLPSAIPPLTLEQVDSLWSALIAEFAIEDATTQSASVKQQKLADVIVNDPVAQHLMDRDLVRRIERDGRLHITCPFEDEHSEGGGESSTTYFPAHTGGYANGHFACLHAHCEHRSDSEFKDAIGFVDDELLSDFENLASALPAQSNEPLDDLPTTTKIERNRFAVLTEDEFLDAPPVEWHIKHVLPKAELVVMFGESGSGKSFMALDLAACVVQGLDWRGHKTRKGRVVYIAAEGAHGFRNRIRAYKMQRQINRLGVEVIANAPNLLEKSEALDVARAIGRADLVIVDTFAQTTAGGNENSGEDVGRALMHCKGIHRATGATVLLIHHSGKDSTKGARGWSGLRAAADAEFEVCRADNDRSMTVTKMKDGQDGAEFGFKLGTVLLGMDEDDEDITSCIVEHNEGGRVVKQKAERLGGNEKITMQVARDYLALHECEEIEERDLVSEVTGAMPRGDSAKDRRSELACKALRSLVARNVLQVVGSKVRLA